MEWFAFQKFNSFRNFWKLSWKILYLFERFGWMESALYQLIKYICICAINCQPGSYFKAPLKQSCTPRRLNASHKSRLKEKVPINHLFHFLFYFILVNDKDVLKTAQCTFCTLSAFPAPTPFSLAFSIAKDLKAFFSFFSLCPLFRTPTSRPFLSRLL